VPEVFCVGIGPQPASNSINKGTRKAKRIIAGSSGKGHCPARAYWLHGLGPNRRWANRGVHWPERSVSADRRHLARPDAGCHSGNCSAILNRTRVGEGDIGGGAAEKRLFDQKNMHRAMYRRCPIYFDVVVMLASTNRPLWQTSRNGPFS